MAGINLEMLMIAATRLKDVLEDVVFVGGSITELYITDPASMDIRETKDVDVIIETLTYAEYINFADRLKSVGFQEDTRDGAPICRWVNQETTLDVMPIGEKILGFTNKWYSPAFVNFNRIELSSEVSIKLVKPEYFIATKIEAFNGRGNNDYYASHDLEDIITLIDGRAELIEELSSAEAGVKKDVAAFFDKSLNDNAFMNALPGHLSSDVVGGGRIGILIERLRKISSL